MERSGTLAEPSDNSTTPYIKKRPTLLGQPLIGRRVKVRLVDYQNQQLNELANHKIGQVFERCNVNAHSLDYCPGLNLYVIENANQEVMKHWPLWIL